MANLYWAISRKSFLFACLLISVNGFSAIANFSGVSANAQEKNQDETQKKQEQSNSKRKSVEAKDPISKKPDIKQVPKARKQLKPAAVKPKVKPVRIIKPKIKKP